MTIDVNIFQCKVSIKRRKKKNQQYISVRNWHEIFSLRAYQGLSQLIAYLQGLHTPATRKEEQYEST